MSDKKFKKIGAIPAMLIRFALTIIKNNLISIMIIKLLSYYMIKQS